MENKKSSERFKNTERKKNKMTKKIELQLFADGEGAENQNTQTTQTAENNAENKENKEGKESVKQTELKAEDKKYTDADLDRIINKKFAELQKKKEKEVAEAKKLAEMNAQEKAEYERDQLQKELDALKKKDTLSEMTKTARNILSEENINLNDNLLSMLVTTDAEQTKTAINNFSKLFKEAVESAVKERLRGNTPRRGTGSGASKTITKEEIMSIKDAEARQKAILDNKHLFNFKI